MWKGEHHLYNFWLDTAGYEKLVSISLETDFYFEKDIMSVIEKSRNVVSWIIIEKEMKNDVKKLMQIK